jgi:phosphodiesterase/alkaline phosphatase D-like protein
VQSIEFGSEKVTKLLQKSHHIGTYSRFTSRMKKFVSFRIIALAFISACIIQPTRADASVNFIGVAAGDATTDDVTFWTRAKDESNPQPTAINVQISTDPTFSSGVTTLLAGTADSTTDYTVKTNVAGLESATVYYYRFQTLDASVTSNVGKFKTAPEAKAHVPVHFAFSGDCDGLIRPYALASQMPARNLDFFMFDGDTEYETSASIGSPAVHSTGNIPDPMVTVPTATHAQLSDDFSRKYREQFLPVNVGGQNCLQPFFAGQGNYTAYDNHELGNKQYINGGAAAGGPVGSTTGSAPFDFLTGAGVDARVSSNDVTPNDGSVPFMNKSGGFQTLQQIFENYQPLNERGLINAPADPRTNGTRQLYFAQKWGRNAILINTDCRTYRDIRMKTAANADDTGPRSDNPNRTMLGATQLTWLEQTLLDAQHGPPTWKFINISDPIDQIGPIGGSLTLVNPPTTAEYGLLGNITSITTTAASSGNIVTVARTVGLVVGQPVSGTNVPPNTTIASINTDGTTFTINNTPAAPIPSGVTLTLSGAASTYFPVTSDGGKSWMGGYRAERNALLKFIADNEILNVVFLSTDDHQNRINELTYSPTGQTADQSTYVKVPYCFEIVCGPLGATGPDLISNHSFSLVKKLADSIANAESAAGIEPIGLAGYPGLRNVMRLGDPAADTLRQPADFYSPDTFNYNVLDVSADGKTLTVTSYGINSTVQNGFVEYDPVNNPEQALFSFQIRRGSIGN